MAKSATSHISQTSVEHILTLSPLHDSEHIRALPRLPEKRDSEFLHLGMQVRGSSAVSHHGTEVVLKPGDLVFCDRDRPHFTHLGNDCQVTVFRISRHHLGVSESDLRRIAGVSVRRGEGVGAMASIFLSALAAGAEFRTSRIGDRLIRSAVDLVTVLVMELLAEASRPKTSDASNAGNEMLTRIREFIEVHLMDPDLSPKSIALAHHISVRYLHKLFQNDGTTVSQWVRQRRLSASRQELGRTSNRRLTVAAVARRLGFISPSHFSRVFRDAYGMSPSEWQACTWSALESPITKAQVPFHQKSVLTRDAA
ncbi:MULTISPECIES: AraC family transcriptional regulator [Streptomyces]|uniref:AraC family transcriptional regulator n=1 Tax=Streptomyces mirabilis TaxID=68239 RepID=A0ABU3UGY4_9ACTN|nr:MULTISPECIES: AraC family transcriptional regulator [Streptomyces]MCX4613123.1 AraC family transcriptional regulator [Streptomyces mirabilis]MCX5353254.1 AraC family transcriptional regulator [Streptomyces mirabilis]MDU8993172.1 AraC family transcriptional regulator [Streptomyces mirabilis]QDN91264.1 helix-turn-helix domain-containing protein [Streptomyces sp. RLB3-6]